MPSTLGFVPHNYIVKGGLRNMAIGNFNSAGGGHRFLLLGLSG
nr:MAG TPA: hypothetical protein [Caudoviricetes sp.]